MLTTIIYRSHICDNVSIKSLDSMVAEANVKNAQTRGTIILLNYSGIMVRRGALAK